MLLKMHVCRKATVERFINIKVREKPEECHTIECASCQLRMIDRQGRVSILLHQSHIIFGLTNFIIIIYLPSKNCNDAIVNL